MIFFKYTTALVSSDKTRLEKKVQQWNYEELKESVNLAWIVSLDMIVKYLEIGSF